MTNPVFRRDLIATREEQQGVIYYRIEDPEAKTNFRLYEMEYMIAQKLDGQHTIEKAIKEIASELHFELTQDDLTRFIAQLESMNFLTNVDIGDTAGDQNDNSNNSEQLEENGLDPIEEEHLLTNALIQIKQGFFGHAKDYFLLLKSLK